MRRLVRGFRRRGRGRSDRRDLPRCLGSTSSVVGPPALLLGLFAPVENLVYVAAARGRARLAPGAGGHPRSASTAASAHPAGAAPSSSARTTRATSTRRSCSTCCTRACTCSTRRSSRKVPILGQCRRRTRGFVPVDATNRDRAVRWLDEARPDRCARGTLVPRLSRGHAQPDRARCCRSRRAASSWRSRRRCRSCRWRSSAADDAMRRGSALICPGDDQRADR